MNVESHLIRKPNHAYYAHIAPMESFTDPKQLVDPYKKDVALEAHRRALFFLNSKKKAAPSFEDMKARVEKPDSDSTITSTIQTLKQDHLQDLKTLCEYQTDQYQREMLDRYLSNDESSKKNRDEEKAQDLIFTGPSKDMLLETRWRDDYDKLKYMYNWQLAELQQRQQKLQRDQEKAFPTTKEEFKKKKRDYQLQVARFLTATPIEKERMLHRLPWTWVSVSPLTQLFNSDLSFASEIRGMILADSMPSVDPRRRL